MEPSFCIAIKTMRERKGLLQKYVGWTSGLGPVRYNQIENGKPPTDGELAEIARAMGTDPPSMAIFWGELMRENTGSTSKSNRLVS
ncbi:helix-turn-helix domain-containing protein [Kordiimonas aquimaris]|uniref:helix-turn-helix domain-containing protein n=1 Tax=Kordiimonas aquimaris TaxID=707591 RepID=UPI0021CF86C4|nr:helix-turn-helix transcriptional regulator [Kordiimonas aquimaris]